jgi:ketol-acid reductoisomerase
VVLCGGVTALMKAGFETWLRQVISRRALTLRAYIDEAIIDLVIKGGLSFMRYSAQRTQRETRLKTGDRLITEETK